MGALGVLPSSEKSVDPKSTPSLPMVPAGFPSVPRWAVAYVEGATFLATLGFFAAIISKAGDAERETTRTLMGVEVGATKPLAALQSAQQAFQRHQTVHFDMRRRVCVP